MVDEIFDRTYQNGRAQLNAGLTSGIAALGRAIAEAFKVLNRIEYQAPWNERRRTTGCN